MSKPKAAIAPVLRQQWFGLPRKSHYKAGELANQLGLGLRQLERHFQQEIGQSPKAWLEHQRMVAAQYLVPGASSIKEASLQLDYKKPSNFARDFKRCYRMTPRQFQELHRRLRQKVAF